MSAQSELEEFWTSRHHLGVVREFAYSRMCSPWAVLGVTLCRILTQIPPWVTTPPLIGGRGSLNTLVALVAPSGAGKGAAEAAAAELLPADIVVAPAGSGEGLAHQYAHIEKRDLVRDRTAVMFSIPEIDTLAGIGGRTGSTIMSKLRSAFSGEEIGFSYADPTKRLILGNHGYRLTMIVGVQPDRAGPLLADSGGGTPQRFLWLPATDPAITADPPPAPPAIHWTRPTLESGYPQSIPLPDRVVRVVREAHAARSRGEGEALDGHALFVRVKISCALALFDERLAVNDEDWHLAGILMRLSDRTRQQVVRHLAVETEKSNDARGRAEGRRQAVAEDVVADQRAKRIGRRVVSMLSTDGPLTTGTLNRKLASRDRDMLDEVVELLVASGAVKRDGDTLTTTLAAAA